MLGATEIVVICLLSFMLGIGLLVVVKTIVKIHLKNKEIEETQYKLEETQYKLEETIKERKQIEEKLKSLVEELKEKKKNEQEQIKELKEILFDHAENYCDTNGCILTEKLAKAIYNAGYKKEKEVARETALKIIKKIEEHVRIEMESKYSFDFNEEMFFSGMRNGLILATEPLIDIKSEYEIQEVDTKTLREKMALAAKKIRERRGK